MTERLSWAEQEVTGELAGAATGLVGLCRVRPERADVLRRAAVAKLDGDERALIVALAAQISEETT
ncbi:hypothetical protein [Dactylosporangium sp. CA-139066]|uniref:hypothetical protein n=1 Tax=Dactylosporangium sp. CA-139066 TaxID=3239930 RepID=UPI003D8B6512